MILIAFPFFIENMLGNKKKVIFLAAWILILGPLSSMFHFAGTLPYPGLGCIMCNLRAEEGVKLDAIFQPTLITYAISLHNESTCQVSQYPSRFLPHSLTFKEFHIVLELTPSNGGIERSVYYEEVFR